MPETAVLSPALNAKTPDSVRETVKFLYMQGLGPTKIAQQTGVKAQTVCTWAQRFDWKSIRDRGQAIVVNTGFKGLMIENARQHASASLALREVFASTLAQHADALAKVAVKPNLKHLKQVGEAIEPLARTAKIVHDWGAGSIQGVILAGSLEVDKGDQPRALDVTSAVEQVEPQPAVGDEPGVKDSNERMDDSPPPAQPAPDPTPQG